MFLRTVCRRMVAAWLAFRQPQGAPVLVAEHNIPGGDAPPAGFPPGTEPVLVESNEVNVAGAPGLHFAKRRVTLRGDKNAKYTQTQLNPLILAGCRCMVSTPHDVAYLSDISGLPVCRRCAATCDCGHKVAPRERVKIGPRAYMCIACFRMELRAKRWQGIRQLFLGSLTTE